jgi:KamA family protein
MRYRSYNLHSFREIPEVQKHLSPEEQFEIEVVGTVLPFKVNNYLIGRIDWENPKEDPIFRLTFPQREMLKPAHFEEVATLLKKGAPKGEIKKVANRIRQELNPHPAGQEYNIPEVDGQKLVGAQHKYRETLLFFPKQGQTCHAYCTFCFRWPQFVGIDQLKFAMKEVELLIEYLRRHPEITDLLFTGGDPMIMGAKLLKAYIEPILEANLPNLRTIRIGSKALAFWPYRFVEDPDSEELLGLFRKIVERGYHLAFMAHYNHPKEMEGEIAEKAIENIRKTGVVIRTQSPLLAHINDAPEIWAEMWQRQVELGMVPYYMFVARDTGAQHYFGVPLERAWKIFRDAYKQVSGLARTVKGPSMSATPGKVRILGVTEIGGEKYFLLDFLQGRNPDWVGRPFLAKYNPEALWLDDLKPATGEKFFFEEELEQLLANRRAS